MGFKENFKQAAKELIDLPGKGKTEETTATPAKPAETQPAQEIAKKKQTPVVETPPKAAPIPVTMIATGTMIQGPVHAAGDLELWGELQGDVQSQGNLKLCGKLTGKASGESISLCGAKVQGDICAKGAVHVDEASVLIGGLTAQSLVMNGRAKGDITVRENLTLDSHAIVCGNISAKKLTIAEGAVLQGEVKITADMDKAFQAPEEKKN